MAHMHPLGAKKSKKLPTEDTRPLRSMTPYEKKIQKALQEKYPSGPVELRVIVKKS